MAIAGNITAIIAQSTVWVFLFAVLAGLGIGSFFLTKIVYRLLTYKIDVLILDHTGNTEIVKKDLGRLIFGKDKKRCLRLLKTGLPEGELPLPDPDKYFAFGNRKLLLLHKINDVLTPITLKHNSPATFNFNMDDMVSVLYWRELDHTEALDSYRNKKVGFMEKYGTWVMSTLMILIMFVLFFMLLQKLGSLQIQVDASQLIKM